MGTKAATVLGKHLKHLATLASQYVQIPVDMSDTVRKVYSNTHITFITPAMYGNI